VRTVKIVGAVALALVVAVAGGWLWGISGTRAAERRLAENDLRLRLTDARGRILGARVDLYSLNFGAAAQNFDAARAVLASVIDTYEAGTTSPRADRLRAAIADLEEAKRLSGQMRQDSHVPADRAVQAVSAAAQPARVQ
jgi:hypothetical protein